MNFSLISSLGLELKNYSKFFLCKTREQTSICRNSPEFKGASVNLKPFKTSNPF
jgi:hypothetical protein